MALHLTKGRYMWYFPVFLVVVCAIGIVSSLYIYQSIDASLRKSLIYRAETVALALDASGVAVLKGNESDLNVPQYVRLKAKLTNIREANKDSRFVYLMGKRDGELYFIADSEDPESEDYSPPGQIYFEESIAIENAFSSKASGSEGPTSDRWGTWITGVAPVFNEAGTVIAAVGIDVDAYQFRKQVITYTLLPLIATIILIIFVYLGMRLRKQEQEFLEIKSKFVAIASHDIRAPLTGIAWATRTLTASPKLVPEDKILVSDISDQIQNLLVTANDILDALSFDTPNVNILNSELQLSELIEVSLENIRFFARQQQIDVVVERIPFDAMIKGDPGKLQQLFINLLSNAIKYSHPHTDIRVGYSFDDKFHLITVSDQGIGIPENELKHVFKGFYRAKNAEARSIHGSGLGLYLVKRIAELHGGSVILESREGKGTKVIVKLPRLNKSI